MSQPPAFVGEISIYSHLYLDMFLDPGPIMWLQCACISTFFGFGSLLFCCNTSPDYPAPFQASVSTFSAVPRSWRCRESSQASFPAGFARTRRSSSWNLAGGTWTMEMGEVGGSLFFLKKPFDQYKPVDVG